ncbi:MAG: succinate dehydrogenase (quinone) flavoprotein subunit [Candidatus Thiodiazotropha sp. (ex Ctena orbiculata)]|nr:succinate dehydrogenase (quinone) flavoprotein subunit [Candidatus Thiodiazotropha taylori]PUB85920.1 MAG: succinate dehydrogenase flavoprotein subunit [gamma proteobacterium symbiont of Ctena orbiculata]MBT2995652.1 succinate dehydrogenase (quinone) flavoprotein subunit [Candidatus Thiodiazotropha taylori]MBT2999394.1 succinate dehydrogenase (quinone) flavoprotein subunit [Candidatus Thiodiazotropha taylori]MBV2106487.1 succinate dehydrogenase (quinone) flavoprotein subunit [Candidatus Thio
MRRPRRVIVVGGGLGGLWSALRVAEAGYQVEIFSLFEVKRSHSVCAQGGINASIDTKGERDSVWQHIVDTLKGGAYLANQPPVKTLCEEAPGIIRTFERMGVTFSRTAEGLLDLRLFGGVKNRRTLFAGASTGQQLLYGVDQEIRRQEALGRVRKFEWWEFLSLVKDSQGICKGIVAMNLRTMDVKGFRADAVILATGGMGHVFGHRSTNSTNSTGSAACRAYQQGARFANCEFFQFHPTAMLGDDKTRLMSEAARGEGGRIWVPKNPGDQRKASRIPEQERYYFLEEWYPSYGNTVPRDLASRAIWKVVHEMGLGVGGEDKVYLDLTHLNPGFIEQRLHAILDIYRKFHGTDPVHEPMEIYPSAHYAMGGLWVDFEKDEASGGLKAGSPRNHATNLPGLYACGECDYGYHGANRLGANSLLSASFSGRVAGEAVASYLKGLEVGIEQVPEHFYTEEISRQQRINEELLKGGGGENPYTLHHELGEIMSGQVGVVRDNTTLKQAIDSLQGLAQRCQTVDLESSNSWSNQGLVYARQLQEMVHLGLVIASSALARDECRGAHYKPAFELTPPTDAYPGDPAYEVYRGKWKKQNQQWLKTTITEHATAGPRISFEQVDLSVLPPEEPRDYR